MLFLTYFLVVKDFCRSFFLRFCCHIYHSCYNSLIMNEQRVAIRGIFIVIYCHLLPRPW